MTSEASNPNTKTHLPRNQAEVSEVETALSSLNAARKESVVGSGSLRDLIDDGKAR